MAAPVYRAFVVPKTLSPTLARRFAYLNRQVLLQQPGQTLLLTPLLMRTTDDWHQDLSLPDTHFLICVAPNALTAETSLESGRWVGICCVRGPLTNEAYNDLTPRIAPVTFDNNELGWYAGRLYFTPSERNLEAFRCLHLACRDVMASETAKALALRARGTSPSEVGMYDQRTSARRAPSEEKQKLHPPAPPLKQQQENVQKQQPERVKMPSGRRAAVAFRFKAYSHEASPALRLLMALGATAVCRATRFDVLRLAGRQEHALAEFLGGDEPAERSGQQQGGDQLEPESGEPYVAVVYELRMREEC